MVKKKVWRRYTITWKQQAQLKKTTLLSELDDEEMNTLLSAFDAEIRESEEYKGKMITC